MDVDVEGVEVILVVEDNPGDIRLIEEAFRGSPLDPTIYTTKTRDTALDFLYQRGEYEDVRRPDLILLDWNLSQNTGKEVIREAKSVEPAVPVVVMTGSKTAPPSIKSSAPQVDEYIEKQTDPGAYIEILRSCLAER